MSIWSGDESGDMSGDVSGEVSGEVNGEHRPPHHDGRSSLPALALLGHDRNACKQAFKRASKRYTGFAMHGSYQNRARFYIELTGI